MTRVFAVAAFLIGLLIATSPRAQDNRAEALEHFDKGRKLYQVGEYRPALEEFKKAFLLKEDPVFIFNIAQCHRQLGEAKQALTFYKRYLATDPQASRRQQVQKLIADLETAPPAPPGAGGSAPAPSPLPAAAQAPSPTLRFTPAPPQPGSILAGRPERPSRDTKPIYWRWWFWTGAAAVVTGGIVTAVLISRGEGSPGCSRGVNYCSSLPR
jgi:tetratricopeptide (TPR) repeat protein